MKCSDAIHLTPGYVEQTLPEHSMKAMKMHLQDCSDCHIEYVVWKESIQLFQSDDEAWPTIVLESEEYQPKTSVADTIMDRLAKEERWSFPISRRVFRMRPAIKRLVTTISILFLLVFGMLLFVTLQEGDRINEDDWQQLSVSNIVLPIDELHASVTENKPAKKDIHYHMITSVGDPLSFSGYRVSTPPSIGLVAGFLGIMITVVTMSWLSRSQ